MRRLRVGVSVAQTEPTVLVHDVRGRSDDAAIDGYVRYCAGGYANPDTSDLDLPDVAADCLGGGEFALIHVISAVS